MTRKSGKHAFAESTLVGGWVPVRGRTTAGVIDSDSRARKFLEFSTISFSV